MKKQFNPIGEPINLNGKDRDFRIEGNDKMEFATEKEIKILLFTNIKCSFCNKSINRAIYPRSKYCSRLCRTKHRK